MKHRMLFQIAFLVLLLNLAVVFIAAAQPTGSSDMDPGVSELEGSPADEDNSAEGAEQQAAADEDQVWFERILVTATRSELSVREVPLHTTVLNHDEVLLQPDIGVGDIARQITSLNLYGDQSHLVANQREQSMNFRGVSGSNVSHALLLVDGLPLLDPYNASAIWSKVPKELIDRAEVVRGGGANVWGNLALSGVVNLITQGMNDQGLSATVRTGDRSTTDLFLSYSDVSGPWAGWIAANYFDTDGYITIREVDRGDADEADFKQYGSVTARGSYTLSPNSVLHFGTLAYSEDRGEGTALDRSTNHEYSLSGALERVGDRGGVLQIRIFGRDQGLDDLGTVIADDRNSAEISTNLFDLPTSSAGLGGVWTLPSGAKHSITAGGDFLYSAVERHEDRGWEEGIFTQRSFVQGKQQFAGLFVEDRVTPVPRLSLHLAGRVDAIRTYDGLVELTDLLTDETETLEQRESNTETTFNPKVGFVYDAEGSILFRGAAYTGFRSPVPRELFVGVAPRNNRISLPNPALEPETLIGAELGLDLIPASKINARVTGYWSETENLIQRVTVGRVGPEGGVVEPCGVLGPDGSCRQWQNLGQTRAVGVEIDGEYRPGARWRFTLIGTILEAEVTDNPNDPELVGNSIQRTPDQRFGFGVHYYNLRRFNAQLRGRYVGDRFDDAENEEPLPSYTVVDLSLSRRMSQAWELFAGVENLLDREYVVTYDSDLVLKRGAPRLFHLGFRFNSR